MSDRCKEIFVESNDNSLIKKNWDGNIRFLFHFSGNTKDLFFFS